MSDEKAPAAPKPQQVQVQIDEAIAQGSYANLTLISHTENEFVLDFIFVQPTKTGAKVRSRIIVNPRQAKRLAATLTDAVKRYESHFGTIPAPKNSDEHKIMH